MQSEWNSTLQHFLEGIRMIDWYIQVLLLPRNNVAMPRCSASCAFSGEVPQLSDRNLDSAADAATACDFSTSTSPSEFSVIQEYPERLGAALYTEMCTGCAEGVLLTAFRKEWWLAGWTVSMGIPCALWSLR